MSHNLVLRSEAGSFGLYQTPTRVTRDAMKVYYTGNNGPAAAEHALAVYLIYLQELGYDLFEIEETERRIRAFLALPGARFDST